MSRPPRTASASRRPRRFVPRASALESRELLSTLTVTTTADSGPGSLRAQVAAAASGDTIAFAKALNGRTITLTSGPVAEAGKDLIIRGPGAGSLIINGGNRSGLLAFSQATAPGSPTIHVTVSGLTLTGGNSPSGGGAIAAFGANLTVTDSILVGNTAAGSNLGGAIDVTAAGDPSATPSLTVSLARDQFVNNSAGSGGALYAAGAAVTITGSTFSGNRGTFAFTDLHGAPLGGAVNVLAGPLTVDRSSFSGNQGGAIAFSQGFAPDADAALTVSRSDFAGNTSTQNGGAISTFGATTLTRSTFENNSVLAPDYGFGGAVSKASGFFSATGGSTVIDRCDFVGNTAGGSQIASGGAVYLQPGPADVIANSTFVGNVATSNSAGGGALDVDSSTSGLIGTTLTIAGDVFSGNQAIDEANQSQPGAARAGAVSIEQYPGSITIARSSFLGNSAVGADATGRNGGFVYGGALSASGAFLLAGTMTIAATSFTGNSAQGGAGDVSTGGFATGGAIVGLGGFTATTITGGTFANNSAVAGSGGSGYASGGAISLGTSPVTITGTSFVGNTARGSDGGAASGSGGGASGGAIDGRQGGTLANVSFSGNSAIGGAGLAGGGGGTGSGGAATWSGTISGAKFTGNTATGGDGGAAVGSGVGGWGGGAFGGALSSGPLTVSSSKFTGNVARAGRGGAAGSSGTPGMGGLAVGGGIEAEGDLTVTGGQFTENLALAPPDGFGLGGAIGAFFDGVTVKTTKTKFKNNYASTQGNDIFTP